jgi:hypothetical protein
MDLAKIRLSAEEQELVTRADWILTKNTVMAKTILLLDIVQQRQQSIYTEFPGSVPEEVMAIPAKVSKGENYKGLPYLILDQPRFFGKEDVFAIRHFFWWGSFFSSTLQLAGKFKASYEHKILNAFDTLRQEGYSICINDDPWQHDFDNGNYMPLAALERGGFERILEQASFIKIASRFPVGEWNLAPMKLEKMFIDFLKILR